MKRIFFAIFFTISITDIALAQQKIWDRDDEVREKYGSLHMSMLRMSNRDAPINGFQVSALNRDNSINSVFRGACNPLITVEVMASDARKLDLVRFLQTRSGNDLPIQDVLDIMEKTISDECDNQIEVIRFSFKIMHQTEDNYSYEGTMTKGNGWDIEDGRVETAFDDSHVFELAYRDMLSVAGMHYRGSCEQTPVLLLEPMFATNQERALAKPAKIHNWGSVAKEVSKLYSKECPKTKEIKYIINPLPKTHKCKIEGEDCFFVARKSDNWQVDSSQLALREFNSPISDFDDFVEVLAAGRFDIVKHYQNFFGFFVEASLGAYSDKCGFQIKDPVQRKIFTIEREYDADGFLIRETVDGPPRIIHVERKYVDTFDRYFNSWRGWAVGRMISSVLNSQHRETNPFLATSLAIGFFTDNINKIERTIQSNCRDDKILTAYENMYNYANQKPAITGKYTTDKKPPKRDKAIASSAPESEKMIQTRRKERITSQNLRAQAKEAKRMEEFKRRKAEGIAVHSGSKSKQQNAGQTKLLNQHQANQNKIKELGLEHQKQMQEALLKFRKDMQNAKTDEERRTIQQEFQKAQQQKTRELQETMMKMTTQLGN